VASVVFAHGVVIGEILVWDGMICVVYKELEAEFSKCRGWKWSGVRWNWRGQAS